MGASEFAGTAELKLRWRTLTVVEEQRATLLLGDLSRRAARDYPGLQARVDADANTAADVAQIICDAVRRRMTWEDNRDEQDLPVPDLEPFTAAERGVLRGPVVTSDGQATAQWSNEEVAGCRSTWAR